MWQEEIMYGFVENLEAVSEKATGVAPIGLAIIDIFARDGRNAILLTLLIVFVLLWVDLGGIRYSLMAMLPLACGVFWMVGLMYLSGIMLSFMTVIALPMIVGIGIDDGVHIMHRWRSEGNGNVKTVFASTGKAIFLTSLTTGFAFGSLIFSAFRGSRIKDAPAPDLTTLRAGHPMFISTPSIPFSAAIPTDMAMASISDPNNWTETGLSSG